MEHKSFRWRKGVTSTPVDKPVPKFDTSGS
jgi:hypothetical protein